MNNNIQSIEEFRKIITDEYITKGIKPPFPDGEKEKILYQQWLDGKKKLQLLMKNR